jgi:hypothetical protein
MAVEYRTASHVMPLVIVPSMGIIYLKYDTCGYQMASHFLKYINVQINMIIADGGCVCFNEVRENDETRMILRLVNSNGYGYGSISASRYEWDEMINALLGVQRFMRSALWRTRKPSHHLKNVKAFLATDMGESLPMDIISKIIMAYFEHIPLRV